MVEAFTPMSLKEALDILSYTECTIFAGGTDLMVKKKRWAGLTPGFEKPVMFVSELKELKSINKDGDALVIGAACTLAELTESELIPDVFRKVLKQMASPSIRNIATIGGNICNASPAGDSLPFLYAMDAYIEIQSSCRKSNVPISDFILGPGKAHIWPDELVTAVRIPLKEFNVVAYKKAGTRKATALSKVSFIGMADKDEKGLLDVRIAFGSVAPTVVRSRDIEEELIAMIKSGNVDITEIIGDYGMFIKPITDQRSTAFYRKEVCKRLFVDFIFDSLMKEGTK